jgi:endoglucanase
VAVPGLGCSFPFDIHEHVWERAFRIQMKGVLVQRSGIALGPPHLLFERPVNFHPEHGVPVHRCDPAAFALAQISHS